MSDDKVESGAEVASAWVSPERGRWVLLATIVASSMAFIDQSALNVALPALQSSLGARGSDLLWIVNGYSLTLGSLMLVGGSLGDKIGRKKVFSWGIIFFALASLACGLAPSAPFLIATRVIQGAGSAMLVPGSLSIISASFDPDRRGRAIGTWSAATTIAFVVGPLIGGFLADAGLWRVIFLLNIPLAIAALITLRLRVPESRDQEAPERIDFAGAAFITLSLAGLAYGFTSAPDFGFGAPRVYLSLIVGVLSLVVFLIVEARSDHPMLPLGLFRSRTFSGANLLTLFLYGALAAYSFFLSLNLIQAQGYRESIAGFTFLPGVILLISLSRWAGGLVDRMGPRILLIVGPAIFGAGLLLTSFIGLTDGPSDYWTTFFPVSIIFGIGMGITVAPLTTTVMSAVESHYAGTASGINNTSSRVANVLTIAVLGSIALFIFGDAVADRSADINLSGEARTALQVEAAKLGDAAVPRGIPGNLVDEVELSLKLAFVDMFRTIMYICTGLAWLSALMAVFLVKGKEKSKTQNPKTVDIG